MSTEEQANKGFSIPAQINECQALVGEKEAEVFADRGVSGETLDRPGLHRLRKKIHAGKIRTVVCLDPDRLSRKLLNQLLLTDEWDRLGIDLIFVHGDYSKTPEGALFYALRGAISEFEKAKITERMCRGRRQKARQGRVLRDFRIYGYDFEPVHEQLIINSQEAGVVRQIFSWFIEPPPGVRGIAAIARELTAAKIPTKRGASKWHRQVVRQILSNRTYLGEFYQNKWDTSGGRVRLRPEKEWILIPCPPIISGAAFLKAEQLLSRARRRCSGLESDFLLSGLLSCAYCTGPLRGKSYGQKSYYGGDGRCACGLTYEKEPLESTIWRWFWDLLEKSGPQWLPGRELDLNRRRALIRILIKEIKVADEEITIVTF